MSKTDKSKSSIPADRVSTPGAQGLGSQQAVRASLMGDEIHVTRADGWTVICTHSGSQKRMVK